MNCQKYYLCITPFFPTPGNWRGAYVLDQVKAIQRNSEYEVVVFKPCGPFSKVKSYVVDGINVHHLPMILMPSYFYNGFGGRINGRRFRKKLDELGVDSKEIAVVHCHTAALACFASAAKIINSKIKTVIQYHDLDPYQLRLGRFADWMPNLSYRFHHFVKQFKNIDLHLCISKRVKYNLENFPRVHPKECYEPYLHILDKAKRFRAPDQIRSYVLYNGVDMSIFYKKERVDNPNTFRIGCISNFNDLKDHIALIKAVEIVVDKIPNVRLQVVFVGSGATLIECKEYIDRQKLNKYFTFESEMKHEHLNEFYNSLDLFVLPSYFEGFGCVYTEAAACGVPFIGCEGQGYSEYIPDSQKDLWLIEAHDYQQLAKLIQRQYDSPIKQEIIEPLDINILIQNYLSRIEAL